MHRVLLAQNTYTYPLVTLSKFNFTHVRTQGECCIVLVPTLFLLREERVNSNLSLRCNLLLMMGYGGGGGQTWQHHDVNSLTDIDAHEH